MSEIPLPYDYEDPWEEYHSQLSACRRCFNTCDYPGQQLCYDCQAEIYFDGCYFQPPEEDNKCTSQNFSQTS